ncbi:MAG TPA: hypothetical protein VEC57_02770 [Candidatus Limnocylindrales bacterium]|nr:hypothetical protein [Candidatus Limnocylindrales bacterium]
MKLDVRSAGRGLGRRLLMSAALAFASALLPAAAGAEVTLGGWMAHSPDDIDTGNIPGLLGFSGDNVVQTATMPFSISINGTSYNTVAISTNGWLEFGGNTSPDSDPTNDCLPTSAHTNPFLAAFWDDMQTASTSEVQYGTVGSTGNRTFLVDFFLDTKTSSDDGGDDVRMQVQIHERSSLISVKYTDTQPLSGGQTATIGFQTSTAVSGSYPVGCNARILDDNHVGEGWSIDVRNTGLLTLAGSMAMSSDDISGFTTLSGDDATATPTLPFSVNIEGTSYSTMTISTNGWIEFGGNTSGDSDPTNNCLPSSVHTNPLLAVYWDDMRTVNQNIRYGVTGTSPNRVYVVDFVLDDVDASDDGADDVEAQVQIHERSSMISVRYRLAQHLTNGQGATIGFQGDGGSSAVGYPLTCNGRILDDNQIDKEWFSVHPKSLGAMSLHGAMAFSTDDLNVGNFADMQTLSGNDATATVDMEFSITIDGVAYNTVTLSTNGWMEFGGNTSGSSDPTNDCLPTSAHTNPFLAAYWNDMQTVTNGVRYGTLGQGTNQVFIADFSLDMVTSSDDSIDDLGVQVQVHQRSGTITVKYRTVQPSSGGQGTTIGFQGAGGASATASPLTCNGKILDDNVDGESWSVAPLPVCDNGIVETKESCDTGAANGTGSSCCTSTCGFVAAATLCRTGSGDSCDPNEACTGSSGTCPTDVFASSSTVCRSGSGDLCDPDETCTGVAGQTCPANTVAASGTLCRAGSGDMCDPDETCTGQVGATCPANVVLSAATECRAGGGACDVAESCTGTANQPCPADAFVPAQTSVCRTGSGDLCDPEELCSGSSADCPGDVVASPGTTCRAGSGDICDPDEQCTGTAGASCPADTISSAATICRTGSGDVCDPDETCTGSAGQACPSDVVASTDTQCRAPADLCDAAETCTGSAGQGCPSDAPAQEGTSCRGVASDCDDEETCDGSSFSCPADEPAEQGTTCRVAAGICDADETCDGTSFECPQDAPAAAGKPCREAAGACDAADTCDGQGFDCIDGVQPSDVPCRAAAGACDAVDYCDGGGIDCPADAKSSAVCRSAAHSCDVAESCDGVSDACPSDGLHGDGTACSDGDTCTIEETCLSGVCQGGLQEPDNCQDGFLCYKAKNPPFEPAEAIVMDDVYDGLRFFDLYKPGPLCSPSEIDEEAIIDPSTFLRGYSIDETYSSFTHARRTGLVFTNDLGMIQLDTISPAMLMAPAAVDSSSPPAAPPFGSHDVDHFKCYKVAVTKGTAGITKGTQLAVRDELSPSAPDRVLDIKKPKFVCSPVDLAGAGIKNEHGYLVCYGAKTAKGEPRHEVLAVHATDAYGRGRTEVGKESVVCLPSEVVPDAGPAVGR